MQWATFQLQIYDNYTKRQLSNIFRIAVIKQVIWDLITSLRINLRNTHSHQMHYVHCALRVLALNAHLRIFLDLKPVIRFLYYLAFDQRMEVFMSTKWLDAVSKCAVNISLCVLVMNQ